MPNTAVRRVWLPAFYFLYFGAGACLAPFLSVYLRSIGLSPANIGLLVSIPPVMMLVGAPVWSGIADAFRRHRPVIMIAATSAALFALLITHTTGVALLLFLIAGYAFSNAPIMPILDNATLGILGENKSDYGRIRLWGGVAWGVIGPLIGVLTEHGGLHWPFYGYAFLMLLALLVSTRVPLTPGELRQPFWHGIRSVVRDQRWYVFLGAVFTCGVALSATTNFLFLYMQTMGARATMMGLSLMVATIAELPFFVVTNWIVKRIGAPKMFLIGMAAFALRFALYAVVQQPWAVLIVQVLHGPSFVAVWVAGVSYADSIAPPGMGATAQSIFGATLMGLGAAAGGVLSGALFGAVGAHWMYAILALFVLVGLAIFWITNSRLERRTGPRERIRSLNE